MSSTFLKSFLNFQIFVIVWVFQTIRPNQLLYLTTVFPICQQLFLIFFKKVFGDFSPKQWNGERGIWTLAPLLTTYSLSRGAPSAAWVFLQIAKLDNSIPLRNCNQLFKAESVGFEPTVPFGITGFQDQLLKPLGQLSEQCLIILSREKGNVKHFFVFF